MFKKGGLLYIYAHTPLRPGAGESLFDVVDKPIQRQATTRYPQIYFSGIKNRLRDRLLETLKESYVNQLLGGDDGGQLSIGDAKILLFPVASSLGTFAWVTTTYALSKYAQDLTLAGFTCDWKVPQSVSGKALVTKDSELHNENLNKLVLGSGEITLEIDINDDKRERLTSISEYIAKAAVPEHEVFKNVSEGIPQATVLVDDIVFRHLTVRALEIRERNRLGVRKQVEEFWSEAALPEESIFYAPVFAEDKLPDIDANEIIKEILKFNNKPVQIGAGGGGGLGIISVKGVVS